MSEHGLDIDAISVDQHILEQDIEQRANEQILQNELELEQKRLDKVRKQIEATTSRIALLDDKVNDPHVKLSLKEKYRGDIFKIQQTTLKALRKDEQAIEQRMKGTETKSAMAPSTDGRKQDESQHDYLVRTGKITPFEKPHSITEAEDEEVSVERLKLKRHLSDSDDDTIDEVFDDPKLDDGDISVFNARYSRWAAKRRRLAPDQPGTLPQCLPHPKDQPLSDNLTIPGEVWSGLFPHQKTGVRWLGELYSQHAGGIVGDEMGLGKTIQVAAFLAGLHHSNLLKRPALIVAPATVLEQWVSELHQWWPGLRVAILHSIGTAMGGRGTVNDDASDDEEGFTGVSQTMAKNLISSIFETGGVIVTTYAGLKIYSKYLIPKLWSYCVLDEGHKIRNPNSDISLVTKQIKTHNRIILSGTPIQNNLTELWSLFDFVFPGKLGTLPVFQNQFSVPINIGGYANATNVQVQTAYKCAVVLRDLISPYLLRRMKSDVATDLPQKSEKVLFCRLTKPQQDAYKNFLQSEELKSIMNGKRQVLYGVDILRKVCNHPDLVNRDLKRKDYGNPARSGKMQVVKALLELWKSEGHKTLLFTQSRQMLDILESFVGKNLGLSYLRMDGTTAISQRQKLVDKFNNNQAYDVFLLTTKVGGLGVNLTGASRVIIFDPDWNPSTDMQARERSWRLGQKKQVVIYRLMIAGAIEEKIYHRQIFKQFLTNKILQDPKQKRFFKNSDLHDLFSLSDGTDTDSLFGASDRVKTDLETSVEGVQKQDDFKSQDDEENEAKGDDLLQSLFAKANVHSTVEHDAIIESSRPDTVLMEREASRIANEAAEALKNSRKRARKAKIGTPTWTGRFGTAGKDSSQRSSVSILSGLREKRQLETNNEAAIQSSSTGAQQSAVDQLREITTFIQKQPEYTTKSADVVKACKIKLDDDQSVANLRRMLHSVAVWNKDTKTWTLKPDFVT